MTNMAFGAGIMAFAAICAAPAAARADNAAPTTEQAVDKLFARFAGTGSPGCAVAVAQAGKPVLSRAYGMADLDHAIPATVGSIYEAGSVSKQFAAAAILLLVRDGKLSLDDDVRRHLPEMPDYGNKVTLGQMIRHISGLRDWGSVAGMAGWPRNSRVASNDDVLALAAQQKALNFPAGTHYSYSNTNFNLAALIVQRVSGQSLAEFTRQRIFAPLGMKNSSWRERYQTVVPGRALAYDREGAAYVIDQPIEDAYGNGGLLTTTADLLIWNAALDNDALGPGFTAMMETVGLLNDGTPTEYAAGLRVALRNGRREVAHSGSTGGYRAWLARYPVEKLSVALLCNASDAAPVDTGRSVADIFLPPSPPASYASGPLPAEGLFLSGLNGLPVRISVEGTKVRANDAELEPAGPGRWQRGDMTYVFDGNGGLVVETTGERIPYQPVEPVTSVAVAPYVGRYCGVDNDFCLLVRTAADGTLQFVPSSRPGMKPQALTPLFADGFSAGNGNVLRFVRDRRKQITGVRYNDGRAWNVAFSRTK